jgi:LysR family transcriptional regulator, low CO2-responsive transcriptional regulator
MTVTFNQLTIFAAIAKHSSITKAAAELGISQPSISLQIKHLEDALRVKMHRRKGRSIELTAEGRAFLAQAQNILQGIEQLEKSFNGNGRCAAVEDESLIIGGSYSPSAILLPSALQTFMKRYPDVRPEVITGSRLKIAQLVLKAKIDIAVINDPPDSPQLLGEPYRWEKLALFVPTNHPLAKKSKLELADILRFPLVIGASKAANSTLARTINRAIEQAGVRVGLHCNGPMAVKAAVRRGIGVGVLYEDTIRHEINDGEFTVLKCPGSAAWGCFSHIVYHPGRPLSSAAEKFLAVLREKKANGKKAYSSPKNLEVTFPDDPSIHRP